jgi:hypothetical protein
MASRRALDAKFEVRILDPQLKRLPFRESFFLSAMEINDLNLEIHSNRAV